MAKLDTLSFKKAKKELYGFFIGHTGHVGN